MDFDTAKENIQPLRQGRVVAALETALSEENKEAIENERRQLEEARDNYQGPDPLAPWYEYICWIEQAYVTKDSCLDQKVLECILHFENNEKYRQDRRMVKLYIKYIDSQDNPQEMYSQLYNNGIGTLVADLYIAWSYYYDALNNYKQVEAIFRKGFDAGAQPMEDLDRAHKAFSFSMSQRLLYEDEESQQKFRATMEEKRSALTSLRAHKKKFVGSLRTGVAVKDSNPGIVHQENSAPNSNIKVNVHEGEPEGAAALPANTSVIRSIMDSARKKENVHEPGPWNKAVLGKKGNLFGKTGATSHHDFAILEDDKQLAPIPCPENLFEKGISLPPNWVSTNKPQKAWSIPMCLLDGYPPRAIPCYDKFMCYPNATTEISPEEVRGYKWFKNRGIEDAPLVKELDPILSNDFSTPCRIPPGFVAKNVPQKEDTDEFPRVVETEDSEAVIFKFPMKEIYPENGEEQSLEELLAEKFRRGGIKLVTEADFEEIDDMDLTIIGDRRQSIYPQNRASFMPRKSIIPRKSVLPPPALQEDEEEEAPMPVFLQPSTGAIRKSIVKRKLEDLDAPEHPVKKDLVAATPPRSSFGKPLFKPPAPIEKKQVCFMEEEDANDTCSTQQFNFFIQAQSVSTPKQDKSKKRVEIPEVAVSEPSPELPLPAKLSTIMETTETTHSTKSSVSSANETEMQTKKPKTIKNATDMEKFMQNHMLASFRIPEEQTETCAGIVVPIQKLPELQKPSPMKPQFEIFQDDSLAIPPPILDVSVATISSEASSKDRDHELTQIELPEGSYAIPQDFTAHDTQCDKEEIEKPNATAEDFEIPATQEFEIPESAKIPSFSVPATQIPEINVLSATASFTDPSVAQNEAPMPFFIYEDTEQIPPVVKAGTNFDLPNDEGTGYLHASRKENFPIQQEKLTKRTASDEFFALLSLSPKKAGNHEQAEVSDLLKFSAATLESSLKDLKLKDSSSGARSATPTNLFEDDLNTEKFSLPLVGSIKNSTILEEPKKAKNFMDFDLSVEMNDEEMSQLMPTQKLPEPSVKSAEPEFKVPLPPAAVAKPSSNSFKIFEDSQAEDDLSMSIYQPRPQPKMDEDDEEENELENSFAALPTNQYEHTATQVDQDLSFRVEQAIKASKGNPFLSELHEVMLDHCRFTQYLDEFMSSSCSLLHKIPRVKPGMEIEVADQTFKVLKFINKGAFGSIFTARRGDGVIVALKEEKPANLWEYYICVELKDRMREKSMLAAFMSVDHAVIANNASILFTQFSTYGSIIETLNKIKKITRKDVDEYIAMLLTTQLLSIIDHLHACKIIHGDIKPDNFLVMSKIEYGMRVPAIQLIDFGESIDMDWYVNKESFTYVSKTKNFACCEMLENKPWTYHTDLFGIAGTAHAILFGKYMEVEKKYVNWNIKTKYPRYFNKNLWDHFFTTMLNIPDLFVMPNLQALKDMFTEILENKKKAVCDKISEFNRALIQ